MTEKGSTAKPAPAWGGVHQKVPPVNDFHKKKDLCLLLVVRFPVTGACAAPGERIMRTKPSLRRNLEICFRDPGRSCLGFGKEDFKDWLIEIKRPPKSLGAEINTTS